jgi:hypothetical protein
VAVFVALMVLTGATVYAATVDLGLWNTPSGPRHRHHQGGAGHPLLHARQYSGRLVWLTTGAAFFWLALMILGTLGDYFSRGWVGSPGT